MGLSKDASDENNDEDRIDAIHSRTVRQQRPAHFECDHCHHDRHELGPPTKQSVQVFELAFLDDRCRRPVRQEASHDRDDAEATFVEEGLRPPQLEVGLHETESRCTRRTLTRVRRHRSLTNHVPARDRF